jgi:hypothetical protein
MFQIDKFRNIKNSYKIKCFIAVSAHDVCMYVCSACALVFLAEI